MAFNAIPAGQSNTSATGNFAIAYEAKVYETWRNQPALAAVNSPVIHRKNMTKQGITYQETQFAELPDPIKSYLGGTDIAGQGFAFDNVTFTRDTGYIMEAQVVTKQDMATAHFEMFQRFARSQTRKVKMALDQNLFITACLAARQAAKNSTATGLNFNAGGNRVTQIAASVTAAFPLSATGAANYRGRIRELGRAMDEDAIPSENRWGWHTPYMNEVLSFDNTGQVFSKDYIDMGVTGGDVMRREVRIVDGFKIVGERVNTTTNQGSMPDQNITTGESRYQANFTPQASVGTPVFLSLVEGPDGDAAVSMGEWEGITPFFVYIPQSFCWLIGVAVLAGIGIFNPTCAGTVEVASS